MFATNESLVHEEGALTADDHMAVECAHEDSSSTADDDITPMASITNALGNLSFEQHDDSNNLDDDALQDWEDFWLQQQMELGLIP